VGISSRGAAGWDSRFIRVGVFARERGPPRKVAWIATARDGISLGVARGTGRGTTYSYRADGSLYRSLANPTPASHGPSQELVSKLPPLREVKGLLQVLSVDVPAGDRLGQFPFKRRFESVFVRQLNGRVAFKVGLLEPGVPDALDTVKKREERHFRLITRTEPWILLWNAAGFESPLPGRRPTGSC
jgi:hypothetical protein